MWCDDMRGRGTFASGNNVAYNYETIGNIEDPNNDFEWRAYPQDKHYPVNEFENDKIFNSKSFREVEREIECVDC